MVSCDRLGPLRHYKVQKKLHQRMQRLHQDRLCGNLHLQKQWDQHIQRVAHKQVHNNVTPHFSGEHVEWVSRRSGHFLFVTIL